MKMWAGNIASNNGKMRNVYIILNGDSEGKRLLGRSKRRLEDNIKIILKEILHENINWINLVTRVMNIWDLQKTGDYVTN
jgi:hypothetical protein